MSVVQANKRRHKLEYKLYLEQQRKLEAPRLAPHPRRAAASPLGPALSAFPSRRVPTSACACSYHAPTHVRGAAQAERELDATLALVPAFGQLDVHVLRGRAKAGGAAGELGKLSLDPHLRAQKSRKFRPEETSLEGIVDHPAEARRGPVYAFSKLE